jgi:DNA-binding XRE family transcriptional regulator
VTKTSDIGARIRKLRGNQKRATFAKKLGVPRTSLIAWESGTYKPQLDDCLKMTYLMGSVVEKVDFLEAAGIDPLALAHLAVALEMDSVVTPGNNEIILIRPLFGGGAPLPFTLPIAANAASSRYLRVDKSLAVIGADPGDLLVIDVSGTDAPSLNPFWNKRLLIESKEDPSANVPATSYEIGRLLLLPGYAGALGISFEAWFYRWSDEPFETHASQVFRAGLRAGREAGRPISQEDSWRYPPPELLGSWSRRSSRAKVQTWDRKRLSDLARRELRLRAGRRILGRLAAWVRPYKPEGPDK